MSSSSAEDDEVDVAKLAALRSVVIDSAAVVQNASAFPSSHRNRKSGKSGDTSSDVGLTEENEGKDTSGIKLYQTRLQDLLYKHLDTTVGASFDDCPFAPEEPSPSQSDSNGVDDGCSNSGIRLFRTAPPGIVMLRPERNKFLAPRMKPTLQQSLTVDEDSNEHLVRLQAAVVDGETIREQAKRVTARIFASSQASQAIVEQAAKREEDRVAQLKRERGEEWLPAIASQMGIPLKVPKLLPEV